MSETIEIEIENSCVVLSMSPEELELVKQASPDYLARLVEAVPQDTSELAEDYQAPGWAIAAHEAYWAAAYLGQADYAKAIYETCKLDGRRWTFSDLCFEAPQPCPICGTLGHEFRQFTCGHQAYGFIFNEWEDSFPYLVLQSLDDAQVDYDLNEETWDNIRGIPEVARILDNLEKGRLWFQGSSCASELRCLSARCDIDRFGDIECLGFHPNPEEFLEQVGKLAEEILKKLIEAGVDLKD